MIVPFNDRLKEARLSSGLTQEQLANEIGVAKSTVTGYEKGNSEPNMVTVQRIMETLNVDANFLWPDEMKNTTQLVISMSEKELIKKYRSLDPIDKKAVDGLLDTLSEREHQLLKDHPQETEHAYLLQDNKLFMTQYDYGVSAGVGNFLDEWDVPKSVVPIADTPTARKADYILKVDGDSMMPTYADGDRVFVKAQETVSVNEMGIFIIDGKCYLKQYKGDHLHSLNQDYEDIPFVEEQNIKCVGKVLGKV